jgi:hypothetical protein
LHSNQQWDGRVFPLRQQYTTVSSLLVGSGRSQLVPGSGTSYSSAQCSSVSGTREAISAIVLIVIVMCAAINLHSE